MSADLTGGICDSWRFFRFREHAFVVTELYQGTAFALPRRPFQVTRAIGCNENAQRVAFVTRDSILSAEGARLGH